MYACLSVYDIEDCILLYINRTTCAYSQLFALYTCFCMVAETKWWSSLKMKMMIKMIKMIKMVIIIILSVIVTCNMYIIYFSVLRYSIISWLHNTMIQIQCIRCIAHHYMYWFITSEVNLQLFTRPRWARKGKVWQKCSQYHVITHLASCVHDIATNAPEKPYTSEDMIAIGQLFWK